MSDKYRPYNVYQGKELEVIRESDNKIFAGDWCTDKMKYKKNTMAFGTYEDPIREPENLAKFTLESTFYNSLVTGMSGFGKESFIRNIKIQLCEQNRGFIDFMTNSKDIDNLVSRIPRDRQDDIIIIDPIKSDIGFNLLNNPLVKTSNNYKNACNIMANNIKNIIECKSSNWCHNLEVVSRYLLKKMIQSEKNVNIVNLAETLESKDKILDFITDHSTDQDIQDSFEKIDEDELESISRVLSSWAEDRVINTTVANSSSEFNLYNSILNDKIIIFDLSVIDKQPISDLIMVHAKNIINLLPFENHTHMFLQQYEKFDSSCLSEFTDINCGVFICLNRLDNFDKKSRKILGNFNNKISFGCGKDERESNLIADMFDINPEKVVKTQKFTCMSRIVEDDELDSTKKVYTFRDRRPKYDLKTGEIKQRSNKKFGSKIL